MKLLQVTWAELLTLQLAHRSIPYNGRLNFAKDFWLDERSAKECGAVELFNHVRVQEFINMLSYGQTNRIIRKYCLEVVTLGDL